jgi:hypothetical protein
MFIRKISSFLLCAVFIILNCSENGRINPLDPRSHLYEPDEIQERLINPTIIEEDTTWALVDSPIKLVQNILITGGATLTIEAGVQINFYGVGGPGVGEIGIIVEDGQIIADGTDNNFNSIYFRPVDGAVTYVVFTGGSSASRLRYCDLRDVNVYCLGTNPDISFCYIEYFYLFDISNITVQNNTFDILVIENKNKTIYPLIKLNDFSSTGNAIVINCQLSKTIKPTIISNNIYSGKLKNNTIYTQDALFNHWGASVTSNAIHLRTTDSDIGSPGPIYFIPFIGEVGNSGWD